MLAPGTVVKQLNGFEIQMVFVPDRPLPWAWKVIMPHRSIGKSYEFIGRAASMADCQLAAMEYVNRYKLRFDRA